MLFDHIPVLPEKVVEFAPNNTKSILDCTLGGGGHSRLLLEKFPDAKLLYMIRDPLNVIPSGLSLVTGVLDSMFGFWSFPEEKRQHFIKRLYRALVELQIRFHDDWVNGRIDKSRVGIVQFDRMMGDFDHLMIEIMEFIDHKTSEDLKKDILETAEKQRKFKSEHKYDLEKFGLSEQQIIEDCKPIYNTFFNLKEKA